ncbi:MAG: hypothetical protein NTV34_15820, partial [Proteobacteria bacterium]|nr:hypothetical protein [Pseudomonadota bacterium]
NGLRVGFLKIGLSSPNCESRPGDETIQRCLSGKVLSVRLLDDSGADLDIPTGIVQETEISTWTSKVLMSNPDFDYSFRNFRVHLKSERFGLQTFTGKEIRF